MKNLDIFKSGKTFMDISCDELTLKLNSLKTKKLNKQEFWTKISKNNTKNIIDTFGNNNLLIHASGELREKFIAIYMFENEAYDYSISGVPEDEIDEVSNGIIPFKGYDTVCLEMPVFNTLEHFCEALYFELYNDLSSFKDLSIEEKEFELLTIINHLNIDMILINYSGEFLKSDRHTDILLHQISRFSELTKITINIIGNISSTFFFNNERTLCKGKFYKLIT